MKNNNTLFVLETRKVTYKGRTSVFTKGDIVTRAKMTRLYNGRTPNWTIPATSLEAQIIGNNRAVDKHNKDWASAACTPVQAAKAALVEEHLLSLGFTRNTFCFVVGESQCWNKGEAPDTLWVGVKMEKEGDAFLRDSGKRVSLTLGNFISVNTLLSRVEKGRNLFLG